MLTSLTQEVCQKRQLTVTKAAELIGIKTFDTALPQGWVDESIQRGFDPRGQVVWCYDWMAFGGSPYQLTVEAEEQLRKVWPDLALTKEELYRN